MNACEGSSIGATKLADMGSDSEAREGKFRSSVAQAPKQLVMTLRTWPSAQSTE